MVPPSNVMVEVEPTPRAVVGKAPKVTSAAPPMRIVTTSLEPWQNRPKLVLAKVPPVSDKISFPLVPGDRLPIPRLLMVAVPPV